MGQPDQPPDQVWTTSRHPHVGQDERRSVLASRRHRGVAVGNLRHDAEVGLLPQQPGHGRPDPEVVVGDHHGDLAADRGHQDHAGAAAPVVVMRAHRPCGARAPDDHPPVRVRLRE
jgi:hypothetical protein